MTCAILCFALLVSTTTADEWDGLPQRKPEFGQKMNVSVDVLVNEIDPAIGTKPFDFDVAFWKASEFATDFTFVTTHVFEDKPAPGDRTFKMTKEYDPVGGRVSITHTPDAELLARVIDSSDFALAPLRCLLRHQMPSSAGGPAEKEMSGSGYHVKWAERFHGVKQVSQTPLQLTRGRSIRTFGPSGFRLIDHYLTFEDARDNSMMGAFCIRVLWRPARADADPSAPPSGVHFAALLRTKQLDWLKEGDVIPEDTWKDQDETWREMLAEDLFDSISNEAIGDPLDSPSAVALRAMGLLTPGILHRVASRTDPKLLSAIAPILIDQAVSYDPSRFDKSYKSAIDPIQRLLLGAAAAAAGSREVSTYRADAAIALRSKRPDNLHAAFLLARALADPTLAEPLVEAVKNAPPAVAALGLLALGATDHPAAHAALLESAKSATDPLLLAAALRGLADFGDAGDVSIVQAGTSLGATDFATGEFRVALTGSKAGGALAEIHELAVAVKAGDVAKATTRMLGLASGLFSGDAASRAAAIAASDWHCRMWSLVERLDGSKLDGSDGPTLRRIAMGSGRRVIPQLLASLSKSEGAAKKALARIVGATKDPRVKDTLLKLSDADSDADSDAGSAGLIEFQKD